MGSYLSACSGAVDANYAITYVGGSVQVTPATLSITASSALDNLRRPGAGHHRRLLGLRGR